MRSTAENAQLALLLEVASTPKPGNVDRAREYPDLRFEHFLAGAVGAREGFALAAEGGALGTSFRRAIEGMSGQSGGNTQFGAILLVTPLVKAAAAGDLSPSGVADVLAGTTVEDAADFYRAFESVDVSVDDPPEGMEDLDVRRGADAVPAVHERGMTFADLMERSAPTDGVAAELTEGCPRTFDLADRIADGSGADRTARSSGAGRSAAGPGAGRNATGSGDLNDAGANPVTDRAAAAFLEALAAEVDTFVRTQHGRETAEEVRRRAAAARDGEEDPETLAAEFVERGINPGTTADIVAGGLFVALERGLEV